MAFTTYAFLMFFLIVCVLYWGIRERRWQNLVLLVASYYFYGSVHAWYAFMLGLSTTIDFFLARGMVAYPQRRRLLLSLSLVLNLGVLAFFKYFDFFSGSVAAFLSGLGLETDMFVLKILLPVGLSFFTLKKLGYMIGVSRDTLKPTHGFIVFALYVAFFPQLVAGPIDRPQKLLPQIETQRAWQADLFYKAWPLLVMGFFKKLVIANSAQVLVDRVFGFGDPSVFLLISGALGFTLQIFSDFSAYTDLSRGFALLLGFETSENFRQPYLSLTPTDFWNRWHISLSTWLRDYVFFPVRRIVLRYQLNEKLAMSIPPLVTMLVSGLWHGAGLTYIVWGLYYGILITGYQLAGIRGDLKPASKFTTFFAWLLMFSWIVLGWAIFRSPSMGWLLHILFHSPFISSHGEFILGLITITMTIAYSIPLLLKHVLDRSANDSWGHAAFYALAVCLVIVYINSASPDFIYFQF